MIEFELGNRNKNKQKRQQRTSVDRHTGSVAEVTDNVGADFLQSPVFAQRGELVVEVVDALLVHLSVGLLQALCPSQQHCRGCHQALSTHTHTHTHINRLDFNAIIHKHTDLRR